MNREGEVIGRTVFIAPTWEPLIPVKSPEKQPILTASHRATETGKLQNTKILNHVLLTNKILIWAFSPPQNSHFCCWEGDISAVRLSGWGSDPSQTQAHESLHARWNQPCSSGRPVPAAAAGNWSSPYRSSQSTVGGLLSAYNYSCEHVFSGSRPSLLATGHSSLFLFKAVILLK